MTGTDPQTLVLGNGERIEGLDSAVLCQGHLGVEASDAERDLARAQARLGTLPRSASKVIGEAASAEFFDLRQLALVSRETANPVVGLVRELTRVAGTSDAEGRPIRQLLAQDPELPGSSRSGRSGTCSIPPPTREPRPASSTGPCADPFRRDAGRWRRQRGAPAVGRGSPWVTW